MATRLTAALIRQVRAHLERGGIIAYPTESCYGLGCDPRDRRAVARLLAIKGRPQSKGLILVAAQLRQLSGYLAHLTPAQTQTILSTWPGPVTWLIPAASNTPPWVRGRHSSVAVRVTAQPLTVRLCLELRMALVSTSANRSGRRPAKTYAACRRVFGREVLVVPGIIGTRRRPSSIVDLISGAVIR